MKRKGLSLLAAAVFAWSSILPSFPAWNLKADAAEETPLLCESYTGSNVGAQDLRYANSNPIRSYLVRTEDGWMRVQGISNTTESCALVEYYDSDFHLVSRQKVPLELERFGAFYHASDGSYFLITGQSNPEEDDSEQVYHIAKYDTDWNLLASDVLRGANTFLPFASGTVRCDDDGEWLIIHTCHQMYKSSDGLRHQANVTIQVNLKTAEITDSYTQVMNTREGYVSHSFNQFVLLDDGHIVTLDHGDAYPRSVVMLYYPESYTDGTFFPDYFKAPCQQTDMFTYADSDLSDAIGKNYTGVSVGGFARSSTHYLTAGNTVDQTDLTTYENGTTRNVFVSAVPADDRSNDAVETYYITDYVEGETSASTPHLVEVSADRYALLWTQGTVINLTFLDGTGKPTVKTPYQFEGRLSDCVPVVDDGSLVWYTWNNETISFYTVSLQNPTQYTVTDYVGGHQYEAVGAADADGNVTLHCTKCGEDKSIRVATSFRVWGSTDPDPHSFQYPCPRILDANGWITFDCEPISTGSLDNTEFLIEMTDGADYFTPIDPESTDDRQSFQPVMQDAESVTTTFRIYPRYNPAAAQEFTIYLRHTYEEEITKQPTLKEGGTVTYTCTECGHVYEKALPPLTDLAAETVQVTLSEDSAVYDHKAHEPGVTVTLTDPAGEEITLTEGTDYTVSYADNTDAGTASVILSAGADSGYVGGERTETFTIAPQDIADAEILWQANTAEDPEKVFAPDAILTDKQGEELTSGTDYTVKFKKGDNDALTAVITGKGNYTGSRTEALTAKRIDISDFTFSFADKALAKSGTVSYTGKAWEPEITLSDGTRTLTAGTDYEVTYANNTAAGTANVTVTGIGAYTGTADARSFTILPLDLTDESLFTASLSETAFTYDGTAHAPEVTVTRLADGKEIALTSKDFTVTYKDNTDAGTGIVTVTGKGNYSGTLELEMTIEPLDISAKSVTVTPAQTGDFVFTGSEITPGYTVSLGKNGVFTEGTDYTLTYTDNLHAGTATAVLTGKGNLTGERPVSFTIAPKALDAKSLKTAYTETVYTGSVCKPAVSRSDKLPWKEKTDYTLQYSDNTNAGTASVLVTGKGDYTGTAQLHFTITPLDIAESGKAVPAFNSTVYTGEAQEPEVTITVSGKPLADSDYTVSYVDNTAAGTAAVTVTGKGNYTGTLTGSFTILPADLSDLAPVLSYETHAYTGTALEPEVLLPEAASWVQDTDYTVTYKDNLNAGTASVQVEGLGNYTGTADLSFTITPLDLSAGKATVSAYDILYTGEAIEPDVHVILDGSQLSASEYTLTFRNNTDAGTADVTVKGSGNYTGTLKTDFEILPFPLEQATAEIGDVTAYDGTEKTPALHLTGANGCELTEEDYTLTYADNTDAGEASITITGQNNADGTLTVSFTIPAADLEDCTAALTEDLTYQGGKALQVLEALHFGDTLLTEDTDYQILSDVPADAGKGQLLLEGIGNYTGSLSLDYTVAPASIEDMTAVLSEETWIYEGAAVMPDVTVTDADGNALLYGKDYSLTYEDNDAPGTGTVTITGEGNYTGTLLCTFTIEAPATTTTTTTTTTTMTTTTTTTTTTYASTTEQTSTTSQPVSTETTAQTTDTSSTDPVTSQSSDASTETTAASSETLPGQTVPSETTDTQTLPAETTGADPGSTETTLDTATESIPAESTTETTPAGTDPIGIGTTESSTTETAPDGTTATETAPDGTTPTLTTPSDPGTQTVLLGDVDQNGRVDAADATEILIAAAKRGAGDDDDLTPAQRLNADVNLDGKVDAADATSVLIYAAARGAGDLDAKIENYV